VRDPSGGSQVYLPPFYSLVPDFKAIGGVARPYQTVYRLTGGRGRN